MAPLERLKILMQVQGKENVYRGVWQVRRGASDSRGAVMACIPSACGGMAILCMAGRPARRHRMHAKLLAVAIA